MSLELVVFIDIYGGCGGGSECSLVPKPYFLIKVSGTVFFIYCILCPTNFNIKIESGDEAR